jgi:hypothetical protein
MGLEVFAGFIAFGVALFVATKMLGDKTLDEVNPIWGLFCGFVFFVVAYGVFFILK